MWFWFALASAVFAALVAIFGKLGLKGIDPTIATTIRAVLMAGILVLATVFLRRTEEFGALLAATGRDWLFILLAALAGAASWLAYFWALRLGPASKVVVIDRLSILAALVLAALVLGEPFTWRTGLGATFMLLGAVIIALS